MIKKLEFLAKGTTLSAAAVIETNNETPRLRRYKRRPPFKGISRDPARGWFWQLSRGNVGPGMYTDGRYFETAEAAALAYDEEVRRKYGKDGLYNFPRTGEGSVFA